MAFPRTMPGTLTRAAYALQDELEALRTAKAEFIRRVSWAICASQQSRPARRQAQAQLDDMAADLFGTEEARLIRETDEAQIVAGLQFTQASPRSGT